MMNKKGEAGVAALGLLKVIGRLFQAWRAASQKEVALLVFDCQFNFSNFTSTRLALSSFQSSSAGRAFVLKNASD
jgi:hypothetical protein